MNKELIKSWKRYKKSFDKKNKGLIDAADEMNKGQSPIYQASTINALTRVMHKPSFVGFMDFLENE